MAKQKTNSTRKRRSQLAPLASSALNSTVKIASKGVQSTFKHLATNHISNNIHYSLMENQQQIKFCIARMKLGNRRVERLLEHNQRSVDTGVYVSNIEVIFGCLVDHALYVWDVLWGFISPLLMHLAMNLFTIFAIIACNIIFFGGLYFLLTL